MKRLSPHTPKMTGEPGDGDGDLLSDLRRFVLDHRAHGSLAADSTRSMTVSS